MIPLLTPQYTNTNGELGLHEGPVYWKCCSPGTIKTYDAYKAPNVTPIPTHACARTEGEMG